MPREVIWRKKAGFGAPVRSWLRGALRPLVADLLSEETLNHRGLFRPNEVRRLITANLSGREDYNLQVFQLLNLELWQRAFIDK
jgi:asparagine synthase (glutamine-hydrolysing)